MAFCHLGDAKLADNIDVTPGTGRTIRTDQIAGVDWVCEKMAFGADGSATLVTATAGSALPIEGVSGGQAVIVSAASLPLPTGAATAAKQPALGTAGTASSDVITVQGVAGMTAVKVDASSVAVPITDNSGSLTVDNGGTFAVQVSSALPAGTNIIGKFGIDQTADGTTNLVAAKQNGTWTVGLSAAQTLGTVTTVSTVTSLTQFNGNAIDTNSGSKSAGTLRVVVATDQPALTNPLLTTQSPATSGGLSISRTLSSASSGTATNVKNGAGQLYGWTISNTSSSPRYLKLYNSGSAPTMGSGTPVMTIVLPGNASGVQQTVHLTNGIAFSSGIGFTICGGVADNDTTQISANEVIVNLYYK